MEVKINAVTLHPADTTRLVSLLIAQRMCETKQLQK